jgi:TonB family protein
MALAISAKPIDLPPLELTPMPSLTRIQTPDRPKRVETTAPPAVVAAGVAPLASTRPEDGQAAGAGAGNGAGHGAGVQGGGGAREAEQGNSAPVYREPPEYPRPALLAGIEGVVTLEFAISESGAVRDPHVVEAVPAGVFDEAALKAIAKWRYSPRATERHARQSILFSLKR